jgi:hypothetical protein
VDAEPLMLTADQLQRRARLVQVARALAVGGYGAVNMRIVAEKSNIALLGWIESRFSVSVVFTGRTACRI